MEYLNVSLVANPSAGNWEPGVIEKTEKLLKGKVNLSSFITQEKGEATRIAKKLAGSDLIMIAGGDGTINEVINGVLSSGSQSTKNIPLAIIPLGTANVLARELDIPLDIEEAIGFALRGNARRISLGRINGHYFSLMAGIGFDAAAVYGVNEKIKERYGRGAYILSGIKALRKYKPPEIRIKTGEETLRGYTAVVGNARHYAGNFMITPVADVTKPTLDLCLFQDNSRIGLLRFILSVLRKRHLSLYDVIYRKYSKMEINSNKYVHVQIDGDYFGTLPVQIEVVENAVNIVW